MSPDLFDNFDPFTGDDVARSRDLISEHGALDDVRRRRDGITILHRGRNDSGRSITLNHGTVVIRQKSTDCNGIGRRRRHSEDIGAARPWTARPLLLAQDDNLYHHGRAILTTARSSGSRRQTYAAYIRCPAGYASDDDRDALSDRLGGSWHDGGNLGTRPAVARRSASAGAETSRVRIRPPPKVVETDRESALIERLERLRIDDRGDTEDASRTDPATADQLVSRARPLRPRRKGLDQSLDAAARQEEQRRVLHKDCDHQPSSARSATDGSDEKVGSGSPPPPQTRKRGRSQSSAASLFVCPYVRYDPDKYEKWSSCRRGAWSSTHRVKEHLYRVHQGKPFCPRCGETFEAEDEVRSHLSRPEGVCDRVDGFEVEGFDAAQEKKLHSRKRKRTSEEENWKDIFRILFPGETSIPDPYYRSAHPGPAVSTDNPSDVETVHSRDNSRQMEAALAKVEEIIRQPLDKKQRLEMLAVFGDLMTKRDTQLDDGNADADPHAAYSTSDGEREPNHVFSSSPTMPSSSSLNLSVDEGAGDGYVAPLETGRFPVLVDSTLASTNFWPLEDSYLEKFDPDVFIQQYQNPYPEYYEGSWGVGDALDDSGRVYEFTNRPV